MTQKEVAVATGLSLNAVQTAEKGVSKMMTYVKILRVLNALYNLENFLPEVKISPLANWTKKDVWKRILDENVPYNPLHDQGFPSIGCWPCTKPVEEGADVRAGRWQGQDKTECGIHTDNVSELPSF